MSNLKFNKLVSFAEIDLTLTLSLNSSEAKKLSISTDLFEFNTMKDLENFFINKSQQSQTDNDIPNILDLIKLTSDNYIINSCLFINKACKEKAFIELLSLNSFIFSEEESFFNFIFKFVCEQNFLFLIDSKLNCDFNTTPKVKFIIRITNSESPHVTQKEFVFKSNNSKERREERTEPTFTNVKYKFENVNFLLFDLNFYINNIACSKTTRDEAFYVEKLQAIVDFFIFLSKKSPKLKKILIFPQMNSKNLSSFHADTIFLYISLLSMSELFFINEETNMLLVEILSNTGTVRNVHNKNIEIDLFKHLNKSMSSSRLGVFFNNFKKSTFIEQEPNTSLIMAHSDFLFDIFSNVDSNQSSTSNYRLKYDLILEYENVIEENKKFLESVFLGGLLSRYFLSKSLKTCFLAGNHSVKRVLELLRLKIELPLDPNYYLIIIKKKQVSNKNNKNDMNPSSNKETNFILDCKNINNSKMKAYDPLQDQMLSTFFSSLITRKHLNKLGFINKKGEILHDPDKKKMSTFKNKKLVEKYETEEQNLMKIKENNMKMKLQIKNLFKGNIKNFDNIAIKDLETAAQVNYFKPLAKQKLPSIPSYSKHIFDDVGITEMKRNKKDLYFMHGGNKKIKNYSSLEKNQHADISHTQNKQKHKNNSIIKEMNSEIIEENANSIVITKEKEIEKDNYVDVDELIENSLNKEIVDEKSKESFIQKDESEEKANIDENESKEINHTNEKEKEKENENEIANKSENEMSKSNKKEIIIDNISNKSKKEQDEELIDNMSKIEERQKTDKDDNSKFINSRIDDDFEKKENEIINE